jgi:23S rRNA (pseudouridine1915-N3)-methyltransferase
MRVEVWCIGKTSEAYLQTGIELYAKRLPHYLPFEWVVLPLPKVRNTDGRQMSLEEGKLILSKLQPDDFLVLLDERGKQFSSVTFSKWMEQQLASSRKRIVFLIGGAFGFSESIYQRANGQISLSAMTFSHQMIRLFFLEQLYRAMTILRGESYHNE